VKSDPVPREDHTMPDRPRPVPPPAKPPATRQGQAPPKVPTATVATAEPPPRPPPKTAKAPAQVITYRCSHTRGVKDFAAADCPACIAQRRREKKAAEKAKRTAAQLPQAPPHSKAPTLADTGRLPPGSAKRLTWNGNEWYGVLEVPGCPGTFECRAGTEREAYHGLDRCYREWVAGQLGTAEPAGGRG
jgi:hypothetical protein